MADTDRAAWLANAPGRQLQATERARLQALLPNLAGRLVLQLGCWETPEEPLLRGVELRLFQVDPEGPDADVQGELMALPLQSETVDVAVLPHCLEFAAEPRAVLREVDRVLVPEGRVVILGFNPVGPWRLSRALGRRRAVPPGQHRWLGKRRVRHWLELLSYRILCVDHYFYRPPLAGERGLSRLRFLETVGRRCWPPLSGAYAIHACKKVHGVTPIQPLVRPQRRAVPVSGLAGNPSRWAS